MGNSFDNHATFQYFYGAGKNLTKVQGFYNNFFEAP